MGILFSAKIIPIKNHFIVVLPHDISQELPSRGMLMVYITFMEHHFITPLEPDGKKSHWFELNTSILSENSITLNQDFNFDLELVNDWEQPMIPKDLWTELTVQDLLNTWNLLTTKARWDWIRWIRFTQNSDTRKKRIQVMCSKLKKGDHRPCCFDRTRCTITDVSKSGVLLSALEKE